MTLFGGGFFVQPNSLDFDFIFSESDFSVRRLVTNIRIFTNINSLEPHTYLCDNNPQHYGLSCFPNVGENKRS